MTTKIAINGFGRIGRMVFRRAIKDSSLKIVAINASYPAETLAHLIQYDSVQGKFDVQIEIEEKALIVDGKRIELLAKRDPLELPWGELGVDIVIEATGQFNHREAASKHFISGAKKVILTAPGKQEDITIVMGVNERKYDPEQHHLISNASCTTNCLAPIASILDSQFGIREGMMTTIHSYTNDQKNLDNPHKDLRRARACAQSIIPTTTGAAKAVSKVLPQLEGKLNGLALRVPTPNVSVVDLVVNVEQEATVELVNQTLQQASERQLKGIIEYTEEPLVSIDYVGNSHSAIIDGLSTMMMGSNQIKVIAWYDNEWGYSCRVVDLAKFVGERLLINRQEAVLHS
ncbi:glyceraldehyde-3-phosphate dehydrogenase [Bacillus horti]|uniref:Glyceraldehyde-3-phosphate dehydrogenase n=1 Tax=Caldalkalibacillus horti TaxID=77523 RepID=A0ABT9VWC5_9BACI|nr:glyceraldehyde-3-phosphate dehydrogenase [Bacillus horti]MDQ0165281.1 glyceraldehyde 3-phosphate dehydrogenase [Bacillus horti]